MFFITIAVFANAQVELKGELKNGSLVFTFENTTGKTIANCNFQFSLPEGVTVVPKGKKYKYEEGDATEGMTFSIKYSNGKYTVTIYDGEFDENAGNTIISLPLQGTLTGKVTVSNIAFGDPDGNNISRPEDFDIELDTAITGSVDLNGDVRDGDLVFTFKNTTGKAISGCSFQLVLPEGMNLVPNGGNYKYEKGAATSGMEFSIAFNGNRYTVDISNGEFNEMAGNTVIKLPLQGNTGGKATVSNVSFKDASGSIIGQADGFSLNIPSTAPIGSVELLGEVKDKSLVFTFENTTGKTIANCNFQLSLPEGVSLVPKGKKYEYEEGNATEGMTFSIAFNNGKYTINVYDGEFDETAGNTIITLPLQGNTGGKASVSNIAFGDPDGNNISRPENFTMDIPDLDNGGDTGSIELKGEVKEGNLIFTYENNSGKKIAICNFQFSLPEGVTLTPKGKKYKYIEGDATAGMTFYIGFKNDKYIITVFDGEFNETAGNTIISLPLDGGSGGMAVVDNIAFSDTNGNNICRPEDFTIDIPSTDNGGDTGSIKLTGEVKEGNLIFTYENISGKKIANCNFQFVLPENMSIKLNALGNNYQYEKGDATADMLFSVAFKNNKYTVTVYGGEFDDTAGNTIITLPLQGYSGGKATVSNITFGDTDGNNICRPEGFTIFLPELVNGSIDLMGEVKNGYLVFTFANNSGKSIANCNFQLVLPEGVSLVPKGNKYEYEEGDATEGMTFSIKFINDKYTVTVYDGEFDETSGNTIIKLPLEGTISGVATVSNIAFGDTDGNNICRPNDFAIDIPDATSGSVDLKGEVKDGNLVFSIENTSDNKIASCNFQFVLPEGLSIRLDPTGSRYIYEEGDATEGLTFYIGFNNNKYTVSIYDGEFNETTDNIIITLPLQGKSGGKATVSNIAFADTFGVIISKPDGFTLDIPTNITGNVDLKGEVKDGKLVFSFENNSGKVIAACNFQFELPEGLSVKLNSTGKKYLYEKGAATEDMTFYIRFNNNKYTVVIFDGEFNEKAGNTIISFSLQGRSGGEAAISNIAFSDPNGNNINRPEDFTMDVPSASNGGVDLKGEIKDGNLVFTFDNNSGTTIANCNFQFLLPEGMSVMFNSTGYKRKYEEGDATEGMTFYISSNNNLYTVAIFGGEFDEKAGNTIVSLPLEGIMTGETTVSNIAFGDSNGNNICRPEDFTINVVGVMLKGEIKDDNLVFSYENKSGKDIAACNFQFVLPEGVTLTTNNETRSYVEESTDTGRYSAPSSQTYNFTAGDATEGMEFHISCLDNVYSVAISGGKFNESAGNTIISLPLKGDLTGEATVSDIAFEDPDSVRISESESLTIEVIDINLNGEVKDGSLVFTFENKGNKPITDCNFEFVLPEGISLAPNGETYKYIEGNATTGMTFSVTYSNGVYTVNVYGGEFNKTAGNTIISLPLRGTSEGKAIVSNISFGDSEGNISQSEDLTIEVTGVGLKGDVNSDGSVDGMDVVAIYNIMLGKKDKTDAADVNGDGSVDGMDVVAIYNIMLGK